MAILEHQDFGEEFTHKGVDYIGLILLQNGWWLAVRKDDEDRHVVLVNQDE